MSAAMEYQLSQNREMAMTNDRNVIDVTDRLTPAARVLVRQRTDEMVRAANISRARYNNVSAFFDGARYGREAVRIKAARASLTPRRNFNDAWSGNPATDKAWAHDILTGGY